MTKNLSLFTFLILLGVIPAAAQESSDTTGLPLKYGYYVLNETGCAEASNATMLLMRRDGVGGSRDFCRFVRLDKTGADTWVVTQSCDYGDGVLETVKATYTLVGDDAYRFDSGDGWTYIARYCPQSELPEPWRSNDIEDLTR